jgi:hypothetical protein
MVRNEWFVKTNNLKDHQYSLLHLIKLIEKEQVSEEEKPTEVIIDDASESFVTLNQKIKRTKSELR